MYEITTRSLQPYSAVCYVICKWPDGTSTRGSGTVVGVNDILTALHVVYDAARGGWATGITVRPGYDTSPTDAPFGSFSDWGYVDGRTSNWDTNADGLITQAEAQFDMAVIGLRSRIGDITGWLPVVAHAADFNGVIAGYPTRGTGMMAEDISADASTIHGVFSVTSGLGSGASGGPLLLNNGGRATVVGSLSSGNANGTSSTYAAHYGAGNWDWFNSALVANDYLITTELLTTFTGTEANDYLSGNSLDNLFTANAGTDVVVYTHARAAYAISANGTTATVRDLSAGRDGTDTLLGVERLRFTDGWVALDLAGNAGQAAKILGAVFGKQSLTNKDYVGIGLKLLDGGMPYPDVIKFALSAHLGPNPTDEALVRTLYTNVVGTAPSAAVLSQYIGLLQTGQTTHVGLGMLAADSTENSISIDLIGLATAGIGYMPMA